MNCFLLGKGLKDGIYYFLVGQVCFFRNRFLWKYALLPLFCMLVLYLAILGGMMLFLKPLFAACLAKAGDSVLGTSLRLLSPHLFFWISVQLIWATQSLLYQFFGSFIFDELSDCYERKKYGYTCGCSSQQRRKAMWDSLFLSTRNFFLGMVLFLFSTAVFGWGTLICTPLIGYLLGISCFQACAVNHGVCYKTLNLLMRKHFLTISVFGTCAVLVQMFPFSAFVLTPGFIVGGCHLFWGSIQPELIPEKHN